MGLFTARDKRVFWMMMRGYVIRIAICYLGAHLSGQTVAGWVSVFALMLACENAAEREVGP